MGFPLVGARGDLEIARSTRTPSNRRTISSVLNAKMSIVKLVRFGRGLSAGKGRPGVTAINREHIKHSTISMSCDLYMGNESVRAVREEEFIRKESRMKLLSRLPIIEEIIPETQ